MNYREKRGAYLNCEKRIFPGIGDFDFPKMSPVDINLGEDPKVIGFNYAIGEKNPGDKIVHFYLDDYQFERVWNHPQKYIPLLRSFKAVMSPDFSMYTDFPKAVQMFNHYRKMWCSAYWQENGVRVIPTIYWSDESSFDWCFDGIPKHSLICVSTVGGFGNHKECDKEAWLRGYKKCLEVLEPSEILLFGKHFPEIARSDIIRVVGNTNLINKRTKSRKPEIGVPILAVPDEIERLEENVYGR